VSQEVGRISQVFRYPVKSMAGVSVDAASLGWHGLDGDRRLAFRRVDDKGGFPWLTAKRVAELILYRPFGQAERDPLLPTHVRTPDGNEMPLDGEELREALSRRCGSAVELMQLDRGIFDDASVSVIAGATIRAIEQASGCRVDARRFRPNIVVEAPDGAPFEEDRWVGKRLVFGAAADGPAVGVTKRDERCVMITLDPETAQSQVDVMKTAVRLNGHHAGVYATVIRKGALGVGQAVYLAAADS